MMKIKIGLTHRTRLVKEGAHYRVEPDSVMFDNDGRFILSNISINNIPFIHMRDEYSINISLDDIMKRFGDKEFVYDIFGEAYDLENNSFNGFHSYNQTLEYFKNNNISDKLFIRTNNLSTKYKNINHLPTIFWIGNSTDKSTTNLKNFSSHFLIMINAVRPWRESFYNLCESNNILNYSQYSFNAVGLDEYPETGYKPNDYTSIEGYKIPGGAEETMCVYDFFHTSFINVVVETYFDNNIIFLTEKTDKPILAKQPFIMVGGYKTLDMLKRIGFKTFDKWWSEDYDLIENPTDRMNRIIEIMNEIKSWSLEKCKKVYDEMLPIIEHNYNRREWISENHQHQNCYSDLKKLTI